MVYEYTKNIFSVKKLQFHFSNELLWLFQAFPHDTKKKLPSEAELISELVETVVVCVICELNDWLSPSCSVAFTFLFMIYPTK